MKTKPRSRSISEWNGQVKKCKVVYVCHPLRGDLEGNTAKVRGICRAISHVNLIPFAPHLSFAQFLNDKADGERATALNFDLEMIGRCDELWVFGPYVSAGMKVEIGRAKRIGIPIRKFDSEIGQYNITRIHEGMSS